MLWWSIWCTCNMAFCGRFWKKFRIPRLTNKKTAGKFKIDAPLAIWMWAILFDLYFLIIFKTIFLLSLAIIQSSRLLLSTPVAMCLVAYTYTYRQNGVSWTLIQVMTANHCLAPISQRTNEPIIQISQILQLPLVVKIILRSGHNFAHVTTCRDMCKIVA